MASFQAKIGWKTQRKRENKNCHSVSFRSYPRRNRKIPKKQQKISNMPLCHHFKPKQVGKGREREKTKNYRSVPFRSYPMRNRKFQKNRKKIEKSKQYHYGFITSQNWLENEVKEKK